MKQERLRCEWRKVANSATKASHAGIIRIGFEGIFSAPHRGAPLFQCIIEPPQGAAMQIGSSRDADEHYREAAAGEPRFQARDAFAKPVSRRPLVLYPTRHR